MLNCSIKENQIKLSYFGVIVVALHVAIHFVSEPVKILHRFVNLWSLLNNFLGVLVNNWITQKVCKVGLGLYIVLAKELFGEICHGVVEPNLVLHIIQTITEHTSALMLPQIYQHTIVPHNFSRTKQNSLINSGEVAKIENVVELLWSWKHCPLNQFPETNCCWSHLLSNFHNSRAKATRVELSRQNGPKHLINRSLSRKSHIENGEVTL
mmetsp:Transcript_2558/g.9710  ORF Transcript_2558/g.9710 Transcript_2558/m.9710 type:complete len:210 (-) Transcript_2558:8156-8785(-)